MSKESKGLRNDQTTPSKTDPYLVRLIRRDIESEVTEGGWEKRGQVEEGEIVGGVLPSETFLRRGESRNTLWKDLIVEN